MAVPPLKTALEFARAILNVIALEFAMVIQKLIALESVVLNQPPKL